MSLPADTIFALSSGRPPAAIAVIRISGPGAGGALRALGGREIPARQASLLVIRAPGSDEPIDQALVLWFPGPHSETGEDTLELQVHGGAAVIDAMLEALGSIEGLRMAEPGEFTRRAFANGRLDLTAVEGLADLIGAETEAQRRQALGQLRGALAKQLEGWRERLIRALALVEASLDFADEGDVPAAVAQPAIEIAGQLMAEIAAVLDDSRRGERLRTGMSIAIAGPSNAGKSTIFNWLAGRDAAIVSPYPGTTRDILEIHLDLGGNPVTVLDTAGVRASGDPVESEGIRRAQARAAEADLILWVEDASLNADIEAPESAPDRPVWLIRNKQDLIDSDSERCTGTAMQGLVGRIFAISAATGEGLPALLDAIQAYAGSQFGAGEPALVTRARHRERLQQARDALQRTATGEAGRAEELIAEDIRLAIRALEGILGRVDVDDILDVIFRDFCIGK